MDGVLENILVARENFHNDELIEKLFSNIDSGDLGITKLSNLLMATIEHVQGQNNISNTHIKFSKTERYRTINKAGIVKIRFIY